VQARVSARRRNDPLAVLSTRERDVLALMAEGRSDAGIGRRLWVTEGTVEKPVRSILAKPRLRRPTTITVVSWRWSPSCTPADRIDRVAIAVACDQGADGLGR
jgi:DNA-binding NarL/FixJ family response regulator